MPGIEKSAKYLLLGGPIGKYMLEDCFHCDQQAAVFECLDILGSLWEKTDTTRQLDQLQRGIPRLLTHLAMLLPTWEQDMDRHMILHLSQLFVPMGLSGLGPCLASKGCGTDSPIGWHREPIPRLQ